MELLIDLFGYLSIVVHGLTIFAQSLSLGGVCFRVFLCRPLAARIPDGIEISRRCAAIAGWAAIALIVAEILTIGLEAAALSSAVGIGIADTLGAQFAVAGGFKIAGGDLEAVHEHLIALPGDLQVDTGHEIGRASCRERV